MTRTTMAAARSAQDRSNKIKAATTRTFLLFILAGCAAATTNFGSRLLFSLVVRFEYAVILAHLVGMVTAFSAFRIFVFGPSGRRMRHEIMGFLVVNAWSLTQVWVVSVVLYRYGLPAIGWTWRPDMVAHVTGIASTVLVSFAGHKSLTFRKPRAAQGAWSAAYALDKAGRSGPRKMNRRHEP